ncbi:MAG: hypothetical protein PHH70_00870 [Candidatus Gracilibacteria bacterium]|nr:hypothetical protein [Candidatus Gracilibacteria bacterium]
MSESVPHYSSHVAQQEKQEKPSFSFMRGLVDYVYTLTSEQVVSATSPEGKIYFAKKSQKPEVLNPLDADRHNKGFGFHASMAMRRAEVFGNRGPLEYMGGLVLKQDGRIDRSARVEQISTQKGGEQYEYASKEISISSLLAHARNSFRESDTVNFIDKLYAGDRMYLQFEDNSDIYAISVKNSSRIVDDKIFALCEITREQKNGKYIIQEGLIRLPLITHQEILVTHAAKKIEGLSGKKITSIKLQRRSDFITH